MIIRVFWAVVLGFMCLSGCGWSPLQCSGFRYKESDRRNVILSLPDRSQGIIPKSLCNAQHAESRASACFETLELFNQLVQWHAAHRCFSSTVPSQPVSWRPLQRTHQCLAFLLQWVTGFLSAKNYTTFYGGLPLLPGTLLDVAVTSTPTAGPDGAIAQVGSPAQHP